MDPKKEDPTGTTTQLVLSLALGGAAFLSFCVLRPRWAGLYGARKKQNNQAAILPELPTSMFGWMPILYRITDEQILAAAGLDAYVFLAFFSMAAKFLLVTLFFSLVVIKPIHDLFPEETPGGKKKKDGGKTLSAHDGQFSLQPEKRLAKFLHVAEYDLKNHYLWMYLVFAYVFTGLLAYLIVSATRRIIDVRQEYLGTKSTLTDRTIRLSGIPKELRAEEKIKEVVEELEIGKVESVSLVRDWKELDDAVAERMAIVRKLEEAWTLHLGSRRIERNRETLPVSQPRPGPEVHGDDTEESSRLLNGGHIPSHERDRPTTRVWYGRFKLRYNIVDAIDYYEEKLRRVDENILELRKKDFRPAGLAFVTMDSVASCQMAAQAVLDPLPLKLMANTSPAPSDVVWPNTYLPRRKRMLKSWSITIVISLLSVLWSVYLGAVAGLLDKKALEKAIPGFGEYLADHPFLDSLVATQLTTGLTTLLALLVPFLFQWLSSQQGMISEGDVELSVISKNFFFTIFNFFIVFTLLGTAFKTYGEYLKDTSKVGTVLAQSLQRLLGFYNNFIILQGLGLMPFRLLEFGSLATYPIMRIGSKTPRDYAELVEPPEFSYGFFMPQVILIFIICVVYSVLRESWRVLLSGLVYFIIGRFVYKYQLLYAMESRQHSTGRAWTMICDRAISGLIIFQLTVAGQLALKKAWKRSIGILPLLVATLWFAYLFSQTYKPLMRFIALRSIRRAEHSERGQRNSMQLPLVPADQPEIPRTDLDRAIEGIRDGQKHYVNPSLIVPLDNIWIADQGARAQEGYGHTTDGDEADAS